MWTLAKTRPATKEERFPDAQQPDSFFSIQWQCAFHGKLRTLHLITNRNTLKKEELLCRLLERLDFE